MKKPTKPKESAVSIPGPRRNNYTAGQLLTAEDFRKEQDFFLEKIRQTNRALFSPGIIRGLELTCARQTVAISPGLAMDRSGRLMELGKKQKIALPDQGGPWDIFMELTEEECDPSPFLAPDAPVDASDTCFCSIREVIQIWAEKQRRSRRTAALLLGSVPSQ